MFRSLVSILIEVLEKDGGLFAIEDYKGVVKREKLIYSNPLNSNSIHSYARTISHNDRLVIFDIQADEITISSPDSQSACLVRIIIVNVRVITSKWNEVGIMPVWHSSSQCSNETLAKELHLLQQRFLFLLLRDTIVASRNGIMIDGAKFVVRIVTIVCDQKQ